jgi:hypothetical protein
MPAADVPAISWGADILEGKYRSTEPPKELRTISNSRPADLRARSDIDQQSLRSRPMCLCLRSWAGMRLFTDPRIGRFAYVNALRNPHEKVGERRRTPKKPPPH